MSFECEFCSKTFVRESSFIKHQATCEKKLRYDNRHSPGPRIGYLLYLEFYRIRCRKQKQPSYMDFIHDRSFNMFESLGLKVGMIHSKHQDALIRYLMLSTHFTLVDFSRMRAETLFELYTRHRLYDERPVDAMERSLTFIKDWCDLEGYSVPQFFDFTCCDDAVQLIYLGEISPWVWAISQKSSDKWLSRMSSDQINKVYRVYHQNSWENLILLEKGVNLNRARSELLKHGLL